VTTPVAVAADTASVDEDGGGDSGKYDGGQGQKSAALQLNQIGADIQLTAAVRNAGTFPFQSYHKKY
jgi:hypothetical protein